MAFQQYFVQEWKSLPPQTSSDTEKTIPCFDCNICLDFAHDPVVTLCGHLYCWPCIYKWLDLQAPPLDSDELPKCPVCKAKISEKTLVPLYGRGLPLTEPKNEEEIVPPRPPACGTEGIIDISSRVRNFRNSYTNYENNETVVVSDSLGGVFGEMVYARVFGNSQSLYTYPNSYDSVASSSPRMRRADESLNRVTIFLCCCFLLCLLSF